MQANIIQHKENLFTTSYPRRLFSGIIKAGLLAYASTFVSAFPKYQWHIAPNSHLQWRDRIGFQPISLLLLISFENKNLYSCYEVINFIISENSQLVCK